VPVGPPANACELAPTLASHRRASRAQSAIPIGQVSVFWDQHPYCPAVRARECGGYSNWPAVTFEADGAGCGNLEGGFKDFAVARALSFATLDGDDDVVPVLRPVLAQFSL